MFYDKFVTPYRAVSPIVIMLESLERSIGDMSSSFEGEQQ